MELYVIEGDYGLPSLDVECIKSIVFTKVAKVPVTVKLRNGIKSCASYSAPTLLDGRLKFTNFKNIIKHLRTLHHNIDCGLTSKQASDLCAMESLAESNLHPILTYVQWVEPRNCDELTSPWYMKALPFPFNYIYVKRMRDSAAEFMDTLYPNGSNEVIKDYMRKSAINTLSTLSTRLGTSLFFYGDCLTTLDVIMYAYLAPLVKIPYPSTEVTNLMSMWPNLLNFVKRIDSRYFSGLNTLEPKYVKKKEQLQQDDEEVSYLALFVLLTSASTLMFCFALNKGIIKFSN